MGGQVAEAFGALIQRMWASNVTGAVPPREFKHALSKFAPSFSGYGQQDSQELLAFLLDGIHEDLNRIKSKPATNSPDWEGGGDRELLEMANACWEQYRSRNNSVIVDLFQGQYRSTVVCPDCDKVSCVHCLFLFLSFPTHPDTRAVLDHSLGIDHVRSFYVCHDELAGQEDLDREPEVRPFGSDENRYNGSFLRSVFIRNPLIMRSQVKFEHPLSGTIKSMKVAIGGFMNVDPKNVSH